MPQELSENFVNPSSDMSQQDLTPPSASETQNPTPRPKQRYVEVSGTDQYGRAKAHVIVTYSERFSDGTVHALSTVQFTNKAILSVFRHAGYVNVNMDFKDRRDVDLALLWQMLTDYSNPINSVDWLPDEIESGKYLDANGVERFIWFPYVEVAISLTGKETDFVIVGQNPIFYTLQPAGPQSLDPTVLQLTFEEGWFHVVEEPKDGISLERIREEAIEELAAEMSLDKMDRAFGEDDYEVE